MPNAADAIDWQKSQTKLPDRSLNSALHDRIRALAAAYNCRLSGCIVSRTPINYYFSSKLFAFVY
jgi:hypothetical protein